MVVKISIALQLLSALAYLERQTPPVVHRDIKPQNIFFKGRSAVLGDFGLMKRVADSDDGAYKESLGAGMPFRYRTPDQVAYLNGQTALTPKSDVFQLGLVLAELFCGRNPQRPAEDFSSPVELDSLGKIPGSLATGIANLLHRMLEIDASSRQNASEFQDAWEGIFKVAVERAQALEGRAFP